MADQVGKELQELLEQCAAAPSRLERYEAAVRTVLRELNDLVALAATLQKEAADTEFEAVRPDLKAFIDGSLLQRIGFVALRAPQVIATLRPLGQGLRDLRGDCEAMMQRARTEPPAGANRT